MVNRYLKSPGLTDKVKDWVLLIFRGIIRQDLKEEMSPSLFNIEEAITVLDYAKDISEAELHQVEGC